MAFRLGMTVDLCMAHCAHAHFDYLDLDGSAEGEKNPLNYLDSEASNKHAGIGFVSHDLDFEKFIRLGHLVYLFIRQNDFTKRQGSYASFMSASF